MLAEIKKLQQEKGVLATWHVFECEFLAGFNGLAQSDMEISMNNWCRPVRQDGTLRDCQRELD